MDNITGYQYIDQPANELLEKLSPELRVELEVIYTKIYSAGKAEGYSVCKMEKLGNGVVRSL
jgi:hypothetical protein